ncbi:MAG TPA: hypothetical protein VFR43_01695 [Gaiellaceae bacterium]|nr:hypothetical protein [Gaiellaceae bacterium]
MLLGRLRSRRKLRRLIVELDRAAGHAGRAVRPLPAPVQRASSASPLRHRRAA